MDTHNTDVPKPEAATGKKRGRKPVGDKPMTSAERMRRLREKMRAEGAKDFMVTVGPYHMVWVKHLAEQQGINDAAALRMVLDNAMDYFAAFMTTFSAMKVAGATPEECDDFAKAHWPISPPQMPEILARMIEAAE